MSLLRATYAWRLAALLVLAASATFLAVTHTGSSKPATRVLGVTITQPSTAPSGGTNSSSGAAETTASGGRAVAPAGGGTTATGPTSNTTSSAGRTTNSGTTGATGAGGPGNGKGNSTGSGPSGTFGLSGTLSGVVPGASAMSFPITVTNPNPWPIQVLSVSPTVRSVSGNPCPGWLTVTGYTYVPGGAAVTVSARSTSTLDLTASYADSPTDDQTTCMDLPYTVDFSGTAQMVARP